MVGDSADARAPRRHSPRPLRCDAARILAAVGDKRAALDGLQRDFGPAIYWQYHDLIYRLMRDCALFKDYLKPRD